MIEALSPRISNRTFDYFHPPFPAFVFVSFPSMFQQMKLVIVGERDYPVISVVETPEAKESPIPRDVV